MVDRGSKIRAFAICTMLLEAATAGAQVSGVGVVTPVRLCSPALAGQFRKWVWLGYEPSRFGIPELHWGILGVIVPLRERWTGGVELRGRAAQEFSQLRLRGLMAMHVTEFFAAGVGVEVVRYSVIGIPVRWWGKVDLGVHAELSPRVRVGVGVEDIVPARWGDGVGTEQRIAFGCGWQGEGWGCAVDAVIARSTPPILLLTTTTTLTAHTPLTLQLSTSPPQLYVTSVVLIDAFAIGFRLGFHAALGWSQGLALLYRWEY